MAVAVKNNSRLRFGTLLSVGGVTFWDLLDLPEIVPQSDDLQYVVQSNDRIDLLAYRFYGDSVLWWVIAAANDMELVPSDLALANTLRIPSPRYVTQRLFDLKNRRRG